MINWRLPGRVPLRLRVLFRGVFALLALALVALALSVLQDEKQRSHGVYAEALKKSQAQIAARLRHPSGQLALLNPGAADRPAQPVRPLMLPFGALDFDDRTKAQQAVEVAGCALQYPSGATLCAAVGSNPYAGGFVYLVASLAAGELVAHQGGDLALTGTHRAVVELNYRGQASRWVAPYELSADGRGRLTGYVGDAPIAYGARPQREFRGWLWQEGAPGPAVPAAPRGDLNSPAKPELLRGRCIDTAALPGACARRSFISIRLPVEVFRDALAAKNPVWPPPDLHSMTLRLRLLAPDDAAPLFDSDEPGATLPFSVAELQALLLPGEKLTVQRAGSTQPLLNLTGATPLDEPIAPWVAQLIRRLPVAGFDAPLQSREAINTPLGEHELVLSGDIRSVNLALAAVATRLAWTVGAMLLAVGATWAVIELFVIRRITLLTQRAAAVSADMRAGMRAGAGPGGLASLDLSDLGGRDELGVLAQGLKDLLQRVNDDLRREQIRAQQEQDMWQAVGHEIMSPLQSLMALHSTPGDASARYIGRMQQAVRVLYGQASPSEAFAASTLALQAIDINAFLGDVARNAHFIGIEGVEFTPHNTPQNQAVMVQADEHSLEDVVSHVLRNAQRHRTPGTPLPITLSADSQVAHVELYNQGAAIAEDMLERIFEYGVSEAADAAAHGHRGQGLFVARTYMAKMGGTIAARNVAGGVVFTLTLPRGVGQAARLA